MSGFLVLRVTRSLLWTMAVIGLAVAAWGAHAVYSAAQERVVIEYLSGRVVTIDPGHGGPDGGAQAATGLLEKDVVLDVGLRLRDLLEDAGATVHMTRERDEDLSGLPDASFRERWREAHRRRVAIVNESGADITVSIHANAVPSPRWYGAQTFYSPEGQPGSGVLAEHIQRELRHITGGTDRDVSSHINHYLLNRAEMPTVVVELGFLSNPREAELLERPSYQERLAWAIFIGIAHYFHELEQLPRAHP